MPNRLPRAALLLSLISLTVPAAAQRAGQGGAAAQNRLPLAPARKIDISTTRGTWLSLDVSPDGQSIVFDLLGDIYRMPITGGRPTQLTKGMAYDAQPRFSPDGKRIVFTSDRTGGDNLWTMAVDGSDTVAVTRGNDNFYRSPTYTPDGKYIIAAKGTTPKLWIYSVAGGAGLALMAEPANLRALGPAVEPKGRYVWYAHRAGSGVFGGAYSAVMPMYQLAVYDRETGQSTVTTTNPSGAFRPAVSRDGKWLAYATRHEAQTALRLQDLSTGQERWLAYPIQHDDQESGAPLDLLPGYAFTPDSKNVIISYGGEIWRVPTDGASATKIPLSVDVALDLGPEVRFTYRVDDSATFRAHQIRDIAVAPDGRRIAFTALDRLYMIDSIGATPRRLTSMSVGEFQPAWSPDGRSIAYVTWTDQGGGSIQRVAAAGGQPQQVSKTSAYYRDVVWSADGKRLVAMRSAARYLQEAIGNFSGGPMQQLIWMPSTGGEATVIMPSSNHRQPHFSARDTARIFAYRSGEGLVSFRWDGTDVKTELRVSTPPPPPATYAEPDEPLENAPVVGPVTLVKLSPNGERVVAQSGMDLYVISAPDWVGPSPAVALGSDPTAAAFPMRRLTEVGGQFPAWSPDGNKVYWGMGNMLAVYDLTRATQLDDSLKSAQPPAGGAARPAGTDTATRDTLLARGYRPVEHRIVITVPRDLPRGNAVFRGARVVTMKGREIIDNADIVIKDNRIAAVGARGSVTVPADARVIDVAGKTIVPGFVDTHYHTQWLMPNVHVQQTWQYLAALAYGVTTTRDPQTATTDILTYQDQVDAGAMIGPRIYSTGPGVFSSDNIRTLDQARTLLRRYKNYYGVHTLKMYMTGNRQIRQHVIMAAKEVGLMPTTEGGADFKLNMTHAIDGYPGIEHNIPIAPLFEDVVQLLAKSGVTNTPTTIVTYGSPMGLDYWYTNSEVHDDPKLRHFTPENELDAKTRRRGGSGTGSYGPVGWFRKDEYFFPQIAAASKAVIEAGGRIGVGGHGEVAGLGYQWEMWTLAMGGMKPHDILRAATILGAEGIGMSQDIGSIEVGKMADLLVLDGNPLDDIKNTNTIRYIMKNGRLYDGSTLDETYPRTRKAPSYLWQDKEVRVKAGITPTP